MKNIYTTIAGVATLAGAIVLIALGQYATGAALIPVAIGFFAAKDFNTTGAGKDAEKL